MKVRDLISDAILVLLSGVFFVFLGCGNSKAPAHVDILPLDKLNNHELFQPTDTKDTKESKVVDISEGSSTADARTDTKKDSSPINSEVGKPCHENKDCFSGICIESREGKVCTKLCSDICPDGWSCENTMWNGDPVFICLPKFLTLCDPCEKSKDCNPPMTAGGAVCVDYGADGKFCGGDCSDGYCPKGYECKKVSAPGGTSMQCVPKSGECVCSKRAIALELSTTCYNENQYGKCTGTRLCAPSGLTECDAKMPKKEICNKLDDNCNGLTDENLDTVPCQNTNDYGTCTGTAKCVDGQIIDCNAKDPAPEVCDGFDNDCDGSTDEGTCFDGNPCTQDKCDPSAGGCVYVPISGGPCDDGNACTTGDHCEQGKCVGGSQKDCDDGNPCTDDYCDPSTGKCKHKNNSAPCDDGNPCTVVDYCLNGECHEGSPKQCPDDPPCKTNGRCDVTTGKCLYTYHDGDACDDGNLCTQDDYCMGGKCVSGKAKECPDDPPCITDGHCNPITGRCEYKYNEGASCDDGNPCTVNDYCYHGVCRGGGLKPCPDEYPCKTGGHCDPDTGKCVYTYNDGVVCDDHNACTQNDHCFGGQCVGGSVKECPDDPPCKINGRCNPNTGQCEYTFNDGAPCGSDTNLCMKKGVCQHGRCTGETRSCPDNPPCKINGHCNPNTGKCEYTYNDGAPCDDGNACTVGTYCAGGVCGNGRDACSNYPCSGGIACFAKCFDLGDTPLCSCICL